jgi:hypothetical protein
LLKFSILHAKKKKIWVSRWWQKLYDERYDLNFLFVNFRFIWSDVRTIIPAYGVHISQLVRNSKANGSFRFIGQRVAPLGEDTKPMDQSYSSFCERLHVMMTFTEHLCNRWLRICSVSHRNNSVLFHLVIMLSVLRFTNSDYPFGIFKLFLMLSWNWSKALFRHKCTPK